MATVAQRIERIYQECDPGAWGVSGVNSWERDRLAEWRGRTSLSEGQEKVLRQIEEKVFGGGWQ